MDREGVTGVFVGRSTLDVVYACRRFPEADGKVDASHGYTSGGGPALNAAVAFAGLGGQARLCSAIGEGVFAERVRQDVEGYGVRLLDAARGEPDVLPVSSIILTGGARAIVNQPLPDRAGELAQPMVEGLLDEGPGLVLSDGHLPGLAIPILARARQAGLTTVLDGGSWKPWTADLLPFIDIAIVSSRFRPPGADDVVSELRRTVKAVAVTDGPRPVRWQTQEGSGEIRPPAIKAVDTLGAGDIFHGAFCYALASGSGFAESLAWAAEVAAQACASYGPRRWIAERASAYLIGVQ